MSEMYAIKATTLTALGDAVRTKLNGTSEVPADIVVSNKQIYYRYTSVVSFADSIKKIKVIGHVEWAGSASPLRDLRVVAGNYSRTSYIPYVDQNTVVVKDDGTLTTYDFEIVLDGNEFTFYTYPTDNNSARHIKLSYTAIGLDKNGNEFKYTPLELVEKVSGMDVMPDKVITLSGDCKYAFSGGVVDAVGDLVKDKIQTQNINMASYMFYGTQWEEIPFTINLATGYNIYCEYIFAGSTGMPNKLKRLPKMTGQPYNLANMCWNAPDLEEIPESFYEDIDWTKLDASGTGCVSGFQFCSKLKAIPFDLLKHKGSGSPTWYNSFYSCAALQELTLPAFTDTYYTSNTFGSNTFYNNYAMRKLVFEMSDGVPVVVRWKNQTIDLARNNFGFGSSYNGCTSADEIKDAATYEANKNNEYRWTYDVNYALYNRTAAVETINSLPDASAYVASGGTNTIKFIGNAGALTDGGAINTLTEEEIAVAAAKGWTVSLV